MREQLSLSVFCSNVRGLVCNWQNAISFDWGDYDLLAFNEVWSIKNYENLIVEGYEIKAKKLRDNKRGGGTIIFGKKSIKTLEIESPYLEGCIETTCVKIGDIVFVNVYRPPSGNKEIFKNKLVEFLNSSRNSKILIGGDFNINMFREDAIIREICNLYQLEVKINEVTRIASGSCIDNFLSSLDGQYQVLDTSIADHQAIHAKINTKIAVKSNTERLKYRVMKEDNWLLFKHCIHNLEIRGLDNEQKWTNLLADIKVAVDTSFPFKEVRKKYLFKMSQGLLKSKDKKNKLLRDYKRGAIPKETYINYNKIYRKLIKTEQCSVFKANINNAGNNGKLKWKAIKTGLLLQTESSKINEINCEGIKIVQDEQIARTFKKHFETCASKLAEGLPLGRDTSEIMPTGENWSFAHTTEIELVKIIKSLITKNSSGFDSLSNKMIKKEPYVFARLLKPLINESLDLGVFPACLKTANVIPIFKKGDQSNLNNYRPISLLPVLSKVFEKVLNAQLTKIIDNGYIDDNQFGFRSCHSTEDAVIKFVDKIEKDIALGKHVISVYIDVSKAFDSCDHEILIKKIGRTGLDEKGIRLMSNYLKDRKNLVIVNGKEGGYFLINIGVGQGTVLGPTLFKIYIMDLHLYTDLFCVKFADDSSFECSGISKDAVESKANEELEKISRWFKNNRLTLHPDKSRFIVHSRDKLINLKMDGKNIQRCGYGLQEESVKLLGVYIDEDLSWKVHISNVIKKISKGNYLLWRYKKRMNLETKKIIYESFVRTHLLYCLSIWGSAKNNIIKPLNSLLKKIWKKIGRYKQHTLNRLSTHKILKLEHELEIQESKLIWKWSKGKLPKSLGNILEEKLNNLRSRKFIIHRNSKTNSINYRLSKLASKNISEIEKATSKKTLMNSVKNRIITNNYQYTCSVRNCFICQ